MKEVTESDSSTRTAAKLKATEKEHARGAALRGISLRGWVRRREMERIIAEVSENDVDQEGGGGRIAASSRRVNGSGENATQLRRGQHRQAGCFRASTTLVGLLDGA